MEENSNKKNSILHKEIHVNRITVITTIVVALMSFFIIFMGCVFNTTKNVFEDYYGPFHAEIVLQNKDLYKKISKNPLVRDIGYISMKHYSLCNDSFVKYDRGNTDGVGVGSLNKDVLKLYKVEISKGRMPKNNKEIILSDYFDIGNGTIDVGDSIELSKKNISDTYKVVGFYKDNLRSHQYNEEENLIDIVNALTYDENAKLTDNSVVYIRCFNIINLNPYEMLHKMGVEGDLFTNTELIELLDVKEIITGIQFGTEYLIAQLIIVVILLIIGFIVLSMGLISGFKHSINNSEIEGIEDTEKKKYVKSYAKKLTEKNILKGIGLGYIFAIIINLLVTLCFGEVILKPILWNVKLRFSLSIPALIISLILNLIVIGLAYRYYLYKIKGLYVLTKEKGHKRNMIISFIIIASVLTITLIIAIIFDRKFKVQLNEQVNWNESENIDYDISVSKQYDIDITDETITAAEIATMKNELATTYKKVKKDISKLPLDNIIARAITKDNAYIEQFSCELAEAYKKSDVDPNNISNDVTIYKIYLDNKNYEKLVKDNNLDPSKYSGQSNSPAIVMNTRRVYIDSYDYNEANILDTSQKELNTPTDIIEIGDFVYKYEIDEKYGYIPFDGYDYICVYYPESMMSGIDSFNIKMYAKDYKKLEDEYHKWLDQNMDLGLEESTPTFFVNDLKEDYNSKRIFVWGIFAIINLVTIFIRIIICKKVRTN